MQLLMLIVFSIVWKEPQSLKADWSPALHFSLLLCCFYLFDLVLELKRPLFNSPSLLSSKSRSDGLLFRTHVGYPSQLAYAFFLHR